MLVVDQTFSKVYKSIILTLEAWLGLHETDIFIQKPHIQNKSIFYSGFNCYWCSETSD